MISEHRPQPYGTPRDERPGMCQDGVFFGADRKGCLNKEPGHIVHRHGHVTWWGPIGHTQIWVAEEAPRGRS